LISLTAINIGWLMVSGQADTSQYSLTLGFDQPDTYLNMAG